MTLRILIGLVFAMTAMMTSSHAVCQQPATIAITFDYWRSAYTDALPIMNAKNLQATYYVAPTTVGVGDGPTLNELAVLQQLGWEIGIYSNLNMVTSLTENRVTTKQWMANQKAQLLEIGFDAKSYAPNSRQWNPALANLSRDIYQNVRSANGSTTLQTYPVPDFNNVQNGISNSLSGADTGASLCSYVSTVAQSPGTLAIIVAHKVGDVGDSYTIKRSDFSQFVDCLAAARDAGTIRVTTFSKAISPP